ncbi:MAG: hypothetical protein WAN34_14150 [Acidimicrobiia bacterium]
MIRRRIITACTIAALATTLLAAPASARPPAENNGCPQGFESMVVGEGEADRRVPHEVDSPEFGGNGDSIVCARALGQGIYHTYPGRPDTVYRWADNRLI